MISAAATGPRGPFCIFEVALERRLFLANALFPSAQRIPLAIGQGAASILERMEPETQWFVWHLRLTRKGSIPRDRDVLCRGLRERGVHTINQDVVDISKRHLQSVISRQGLPTTIASPEGEPDELLFVKSNLNFGGADEKEVPESLRDFFGITLPHHLTPPFSGYRIIERGRLSPRAFEVGDVFVERCIGNRSDVFYRAFVVFDAVVLSRMVCRDVIKKATEAEHREDYFLSFADADTGFSSAPDETSQTIMRDLHRFCRAFKLDLGGVDVLVSESGVPHIVDANPTPWGGANCGRPGFVEHLLQGLADRAAH